MPDLSLSNNPEEVASDEPLGASGASAGPNLPNPVFVTEDMLATSLGGG